MPISGQGSPSSGSTQTEARMSLKDQPLIACPIGREENRPSLKELQVLQFVTWSFGGTESLFGRG